MKLSPWAASRLTDLQEAVLKSRAATLGVRVRVGYNCRHRQWVATARGRGIQTQLAGSGDLAALLTGLLDDVEAA